VIKIYHSYWGLLNKTASIQYLRHNWEYWIGNHNKNRHQSKHLLQAPVQKQNKTKTKTIRPRGGRNGPSPLRQPR